MSGRKDISDLLAKARESIHGAEVLFREGIFDFSVGRSYYAMFYAAEAVLLTKNLSFSTHSAVISAFGKDFVKTKVFPKKLRDDLANAFDLRQLGDYGAPGIVGKAKAQVLIGRAKEFMARIEEYLRKSGHLA